MTTVADTPTRLGRFRTLVIDSLGFAAVIWAIPLAIVLVGMPIALLFLGLRMVARLIWP